MYTEKNVFLLQMSLVCHWVKFTRIKSQFLILYIHVLLCNRLYTMQYVCKQFNEVKDYDEIQIHVLSNL